MFLRVNKSRRTFTDTNPEIKKNYTSAKTIFTIKAGNKDESSHYLSSKRTIKSETPVEHKDRK